MARAPRAPNTKAPPVGAGALVGGVGPRPAEPLGAGEVSQLQRSAGNAAVARRLGGQRSPITVQRNEHSAALLKTLATPKVGEGQAIEVQTQLVKDLETLVTQKDWRSKVNPEGEIPPTVKLGGVLIDYLPNATKTYMPTGGNTPEAKEQRKKDVQGLFTQFVYGERNPFAPARFVTLDKDPKGANIADKIGAEVKSHGLGPNVVENTLKTMLDAGQFEYLRLAGLPNDEWKILVEMHYIRARPKDMAGFHKDTEGQSLFVNLNYHVPGHKLRGPEYVLNPPASPVHDELIYGTDGKAATLPAEFLKDLTKTREDLPKPAWIESAGTVQGTGYVAFVDEAIHHATPWFGHRYVTPSEFTAYLESKHPDKLQEIAKADRKYQAKAGKKKKGDTERKAGKKSGGYSQIVTEDDEFAKYMNRKLIGEDEVGKWRTWLAMISGESPASRRRRETRYTREHFKGTMQDDEFDLMLEYVGSLGGERQHGGAAGWYEAAIPRAGKFLVTPKDKPPLKRRASIADFTKGLPAQLPDDVDRRFIRSWVRAVPKEYADSVRSS